ncbi:MAG: leucine-rich repeat domain-containing protein [Oscillospiraceae bacterium]|nr:leucine-rich repeat domain-containing protein [Oscillospiraceae bacterium]
MKHRFGCRAAAFLLTLTGAASVLSLPAAAEPETGSETAASETETTASEETTTTSVTTTSTVTETTVTTEETATTELTTTTVDVLSRLQYEETAGGGVRITRYNWLNENEVILPDSIGGKPVTEIGHAAFQYCYADGITLPQSVLLIGDSAFAGCAYLKSVQIPQGCRYIGSSAFENCAALTEVTVPDSVTEIGGRAFADTPFREAQTDEFVILGGGVLCYYQGSSARVTLPDSVKTVAPLAFFGNETLKAVTLPDSVQRIRSTAFDGCTALAEVQADAAPAVVEADAFRNTKWDTEPADDFLCIADLLYGYRGKSAEVTVPDGIRVIGEAAFYGNARLSAVTLPDTAEEIRRTAFGSCEALQVAELGENMKSIGDSAFSGDKSLRFVRAGHGLTQIGGQAFAGCESLTELHLPDTLSEIGRDAIGYEQDPADGAMRRMNTPVTLYSNAEAAKTYAKENGLISEPLPDEENTAPAPLVTTVPGEHPGFTAPEGTRWIPSLIAGGGLVLAGLIAFLLRKLFRRG